MRAVERPPGGGIPVPRLREELDISLLQFEGRQIGEFVEKAVRAREADGKG